MLTLYNIRVASFNIDFVSFAMATNIRKEIRMKFGWDEQGRPGMTAEVHDVVLRTCARGRAPAWSDQ